MKKKLLIFSILGICMLEANDTLTQINFERDSDGNLHPNIMIPFYWNKNYYSAIGYTSGVSKEIGKLNGFDDSKNGLVSSKTDLFFNWITVKIGGFSIGLQTNIKKIKNNEFGYIHDSKNIFKNGTDYWIAFDNDIELDLLQSSIYADYSHNLNNLFWRISSYITPVSKIDVEQHTLFKPLVDNVGTSKSTTSQDLAYVVAFEAYYDTHSFIKLGLEYRYNFTPFEYDIEQLGSANNSFIFKNSTIKTEEITNEYYLKFYFDIQVLGSLNPVISFGKTNLEITDKNSNSVTKKDNNVVSLGFEKRF